MSHGGTEDNKVHRELDIQYLRDPLWNLCLRGYFFVSDTPAGVQTQKKGHPKTAFYSGWNMGFEPTTSGTTIRRSNQLS
jgi:hypothetical protein